MISPRAVIENTDWDTLEHAYAAASDTPTHLLELLDADAQVQAHALAQLEMSVLHQGSLYSSTAPAALFIAGILTDARVESPHESEYPWDDRVRPLRAALIEWLGEVAESACYGEDAGAAEDFEDPDEQAATFACRAIRTDLFVAIEPFLGDRDASVREAALGAATPLLRAPELADRREQAARRLEVVVATADDSRERCSVVLALNAWERRPDSLLNHTDPAVRACAAIAPTLVGAPRARAVLLEALEHPEICDTWFAQPLQQIDGRFRFALLDALLADADLPFSTMLPAALAIARISSQYSVDREWGPLLLRAFRDSWNADHGLDQAQHAFLSALVDNEDCWGEIANRDAWLKRAGLPVRRDDLRALLGE